MISSDPVIFLFQNLEEPLKRLPTLIAFLGINTKIKLIV